MGYADEEGRVTAPQMYDSVISFQRPRIRSCSSSCQMFFFEVFEEATPYFGTMCDPRGGEGPGQAVGQAWGREAGRLGRKALES